MIDFVSRLCDVGPEPLNLSPYSASHRTKCARWTQREKLAPLPEEPDDPPDYFEIAGKWFKVCRVPMHTYRQIYREVYSVFSITLGAFVCLLQLDEW